MPTLSLCPRCSHPNDNDAHQCETCGEKLADLCDGPKPLGLSRPWPTGESLLAAAAGPIPVAAPVSAPPEPLPVLPILRWSAAGIAGLTVIAGLLACSAYLITDYGDQLLLCAQTAGFAAGAVAVGGAAVLASMAAARWAGRLGTRISARAERRRRIRAAAAAESRPHPEPLLRTFPAPTAHTFARHSEGTGPTLSSERSIGSGRLTSPPPDPAEHAAATAATVRLRRPRTPDDLPTHRPVRLGLALAALVALLLFPQFKFFVGIQGIDILVSALNTAFQGITASKPASRPQQPQTDIEKFFSVSSLPEKPVPETIGDYLAVVAAPVALVSLAVILPLLSYRNRPDLERWHALAATVFMGGILVYLSWSMGTAKAESDNILAHLAAAGIGFDWGFYLTLLLFALHTASSFYEERIAPAT